jgi:L-asparaginase II
MKDGLLPIAGEKCGLDPCKLPFFGVQFQQAGAVCETKMDLIRRLAKAAERVSLAATRINILVAASGNVPTDLSSEEIKSIRTEMHKHIEDWDRICEVLEGHQSSHGC